MQKFRSQAKEIHALHTMVTRGFFSLALDRNTLLGLTWPTQETAQEKTSGTQGMV